MRSEKSSSGEVVIDPRPSAKKKKSSAQTRDSLGRESKQLNQEAKALANKPVRNSEAQYKAEYVRMLKYNSRLIKRLNTQLEGALSSRDIYALSTLMSQQREVINDLRAITDLSGQVALIQDQAVTPFVSDVTQLITDVYYQLRKLMMETTKPKETQFALEKLEELIRHFGVGLQTGNQLMTQTVESILVGGIKETVKTKKRSRA